MGKYYSAEARKVFVLSVLMEIILEFKTQDKKPSE
jgi:hypothetical protein